ncbi:uncharacterized protein LTR77_008397 [Saxophila tyrrhenica]|uniref:Uncharacterized protein n=1 Tax=Saxophila tyrrhenica TaxID=1690608 RepID=A0AAV9P1N4_9PEZI|nr:hypothetical protein LTR77_008397 [Saxophila tyrrhenica]
MYSLSKFSDGPMPQSTAPNATAAQNIGELMQAWFRTCHENVRPADGKFKILARMVEIPPPEEGDAGELGEEAVSGLTNMFQIARGLGHHKEIADRLACADELCKVLAKATTNMDAAW